VITAEEIFDLKYEKFLLREIRQNRYLDLGNGSNKLGKHCCNVIAEMLIVFLRCAACFFK